jgi:ABC-type oligopeptide transport system substrate-binding subunit
MKKRAVSLAIEVTLIALIAFVIMAFAPTPNHCATAKQVARVAHPPPFQPFAPQTPNLGQREAIPENRPALDSLNDNDSAPVPEVVVRPNDTSHLVFIARHTLGHTRVAPLQLKI